MGLKLYIEELPYRKAMKLAEMIDAEYIAFLVVEQREDKLVVKDIILPYQEVTSSTCEFDEKMFSVITENKNINPEEIRGWLHSHNDMSVFWSGTDEDTIRKLGRRMPYVVSIVVNKKRELKARIDLFRPFRITLDDVETKILWDDSDLEEELSKEIEEKITKREYRFNWKPRECPFKNDYSKCRFPSYSNCPYTNRDCPKNDYSYLRNAKSLKDNLDEDFLCIFTGDICTEYGWCRACPLFYQLIEDDYTITFKFRGKEFILYYWDE